MPSCSQSYVSTGALDPFAYSAGSSGNPPKGVSWCGMAIAVQPRERTVEARGLSFHYVEWGEAGAPAIVLLHGLGAMCRISDPPGPALQDRYRLIALDQRGPRA